MLLPAVPISQPLTTPACTTVQRNQGQWISAYLQGRGTTLTVRLIRNYRCARPFSVDASRFVLQLQSVDVVGRVRLIQPVESGTLHLMPLRTGVMSWIKGAQGIDLDFQVPADVPADMYRALALSNNGTYDPVTRFAPPLLPGMFSSMVYVPSGAAGDPGLASARQTFLNSMVYPRSGVYAVRGPWRLPDLSEHSERSAVAHHQHHAEHVLRRDMDTWRHI